MVSACAELARRISGFDAEQCRLAGLAQAAASAQGRPLLYRDFAPRRASGEPHRVLVLGGIHGDEFSAVVVAFQWIERLKNDRFQPYQWRVLPCVNPDGLMAQPARRMNANGVDLNRNFPAPDWEARALKFWSARTGHDPRRYPGPKAASEPETRWVLEQIRSFRPDAIVSVHAPLNVLDFDGPYNPPVKLGYLRLQPLGSYPGSLGDYGGDFLKLPVITLELPTARHTPSADQSARILDDLIDWIDTALRKPG
ncbi:MAG: DUF2817 domain-containing protein [Nevskia sp.]|nr:DUF2817 domain-containing protein [Nevskia sp.]